MSKSRHTNSHPKCYKTDFNQTRRLHEWLNDCFNDSFDIISTTPGTELTAINMQAMFNKLLEHNEPNTLTLLKQRSTSKQNILHFLCSWKLDRKRLRNANKERSNMNASAFSASQAHHIFYRDELKEHAILSYPDKKKMSFTDNEFQKITGPLIQKKVSFYFDSLEKYYEAQLLNLMKALFTALAKHPDIIVDMLLERDDNGLTPLHCLAATPKRKSTSKLFNFMMEQIKSLSEKDKHRILFATDTQDQLFIHKLYRDFSPDIGILNDVFGNEMLAASFIRPDRNRSTPLHIACKHQSKSLYLLFQLINACKHQSSLCSQDSSSHTPLVYLVKNNHFTDNDISSMLSTLDLDTFIVDQNISSQTSTGDTLLSDAVTNNRHSIIKAIQQYASENALLYALLTHNKAGQHALEIAYSQGNFDTYKLVGQLHSRNIPAFFGILTASPFQKDPKHFTRFDALEFHKELLGITNSDIFKLMSVLSPLINPKNLSAIDGFIKEFAEACACIAQHRPLQKPQDNTFTFFAAKRLPNLDKKIAGVTPEEVDLYLNAALPCIKPFISKEKQKYIEIILNQFNANMLESAFIPAPSAPLTLRAPKGLQPVYDHELELRWRSCLAKERDIAERNNKIKSKIAELRSWEIKLNQQESFQPEKTNTLPFMLTNTVAKSKVIKTDAVTPQILDALEYRKQECSARELVLADKENVVAKREQELIQWESTLLQREDETFRDDASSRKTYSYQR